MVTLFDNMYYYIATLCTFYFWCFMVIYVFVSNCGQIIVNVVYFFLSFTCTFKTIVRKCIVCNAPQKKGTPLSFHKFPADENRRRAWLKACKMKENDRQTSSLICSKHFIEDDFDPVYATYKKLVPNAIPSLSGNSFKAKTITRHPLKVKGRQNVETCPLVDVSDNSDISLASFNLLREVKSEETINTSTTEEIRTESMKVQHEESDIPTNGEIHNVSNKICRYIGNLQPEHFGSPKSAKRNLEFIKKTVREQRNKIKVLEDQNKILELHIKNVNELMVHLRDKKLLSEEASESILVHINKHSIHK